MKSTRKIWSPAEFHNFHTHSFRCKHAEGDVADYAKLLAEQGAKVLGMACHNPFPDDRWLGERMAWAELAGYGAAIAQAQQDFPQLRILQGLECEYAPDSYAMYQEEFLGRCQMDYLIGAAHYFPFEGDWWSSFHHLNRPATLKAYVAGLHSLMDSGLFLFLAHPDLFGCGYVTWNQDLHAAAMDICQAAKATHTALELNNSGFGKVWRGHGTVRPFPYPWAEFWQVAAEVGVEVVISADAHHPRDYFNFLEKSLELSESLGLRLRNPLELLSRGKNDLEKLY